MSKQTKKRKNSARRKKANHGPSPTPAAASADPLPARISDHVDLIHGVEVADPYRWLEDGESDETKAWASYQNARTRAMLDSVSTRPRLHARLTELFRAGTSSAPVIEGGRLFSLDRWGHHDRAVLCARPLDGAGPHEPTVLLDPMTVVLDETAAIDWFHPSRDGTLVAYGVPRPVTSGRRCACSTCAPVSTCPTRSRTPRRVGRLDA